MCDVIEKKLNNNKILKTKRSDVKQLSKPHLYIIQRWHS